MQSGKKLPRKFPERGKEKQKYRQTRITTTKDGDVALYVIYAKKENKYCMQSHVQYGKFLQ
jgi:hypothetical protein